MTWIREVVHRRFNQGRFETSASPRVRGTGVIGLASINCRKLERFIRRESDRRRDRDVAVEELAEALLAHREEEQASGIFEEFSNRAGPGDEAARRV